MLLLKQSTAYTFRLGPFVDDTDGKTAETGLTLSQADFRLSKAGGAFAQKNESTSGSHDENGYYTCILNSTDTNTLGTLDINVSESGALPVFKSFMVVPANVYDSIVGGSDYLAVDVTDWKNATAPAMTGDAFARLGAPAGASVSADVAAVKVDTAAILVDTAEIGAAGAGLSAVPWNAAWDAEVQSEVTDALNAYDPPTKAELDAAVAPLALEATLAVVDGVADAIKAKTDNLPSDPADQSLVIAATDGIITAIGALETHGDGAWSTATGFSTHSAADVWAVGTRVLTASTNLGDLDDAIISILGTPAGTSIADDISNIAAGSGPTAVEIANEVETRTLNANIVQVNSVTVDGAGTEADPFGPA